MKAPEQGGHVSRGHSHASLPELRHVQQNKHLFIEATKLLDL
jgi:hypothetical protein